MQVQLDVAAPPHPTPCVHNATVCYRAKILHFAGRQKFRQHKYLCIYIIVCIHIYIYIHIHTYIYIYTHCKQTYYMVPWSHIQLSMLLQLSSASINFYLVLVWGETVLNRCWNSHLRQDQETAMAGHGCQYAGNSHSRVVVLCQAWQRFYKFWCSWRVHPKKVMSCITKLKVTLPLMREKTTSLGDPRAASVAHLSWLGTSEGPTTAEDLEKEVFQSFYHLF